MEKVGLCRAARQQGVGITPGDGEIWCCWVCEDMLEAMLAERVNKRLSVEKDGKTKTRALRQ